MLLPREPEVIDYCAVCGMEIYDGESYISFHGYRLHNESECIKKAALGLVQELPANECLDILERHGMASVW